MTWFQVSDYGETENLQRTDVIKGSVFDFLEQITRCWKDSYGQILNGAGLIFLENWVVDGVNVGNMQHTSPYIECLTYDHSSDP